jgi:hypothetical protein
MRAEPAVARGRRQAFLIKPLAGFLSAIPGFEAQSQQPKMVLLQDIHFARGSPPVLS